jgi:hypothetical protein
MDSKPTEFNYDVRLQPGEALSLPKEAAEIIGPGHWFLSIRPAGDTSEREVARNHAAILNSYAPEDEGLYDDYSCR